ncbi:MAG: flagellar basal body P-ring formation protein FlgA [Methylomonas sp.]|nr:flagellar basal body P-ring formation protein FlgA [Methylomonas sp.]PPD19487.1 MAG: flagella basal body P-ring formation protein FlgA [Methylomonas sp.]PPD25216.1 MAG: flagella basal body P-ring formation protein FlgA [Methylomonas sp.]PPD34878.1 MAG: flagella basal body P-ring formation protein FlgA [Methylomonas sp.]PPD38049.1 MAG: flagella basal body P-ring formation protein FlgA [Methylomonas sp.]
MMGLCATHPASANQPLSAISAAVEAFVASHLGDDARHEIVVAPLDPRLQLPDCASPLAVFLHGDAIKPGRNTVGIRCNDTSTWTIYHSVGIRSFRDVVVLSKPLMRNELIQAGHLHVETRDTSTLQQGYVQSPNDVTGRQAIRHLPVGTVLSRQHYTEAAEVKRGSRVNIRSGRGGLMISAPGIAMTDGNKGQQIAVKNASSQRMIRATVIDPQTVVVVF